MSKRIIFTTLATLIFLNGCTKDIEEYNKPAIYWYGKMIESISDNNLDKADDYYTSLQGEHIGSILLPQATKIMAMAHIHNEEYLLSEHFFDEYIKRYATLDEKEFSQYMKIKAKYMALPSPRRDQAMINDTIKDINEFKYKYPNSDYYHLVNTMGTNLYLGQSSLNKNISDLYIRIDKPKGAEFYKEKQPQPWIVWNEVEKASAPWYSRWFVGDGSDSWYAFLIPDTKSVVSRNSISEDNITSN